MNKDPFILGKREEKSHSLDVNVHAIDEKPKIQGSRYDQSPTARLTSRLESESLEGYRRLRSSSAPGHHQHGQRGTVSDLRTTTRDARND